MLWTGCLQGLRIFFLPRGKGRKKTPGTRHQLFPFLSPCGGENKVVCLSLFTGPVSPRGRKEGWGKAFEERVEKAGEVNRKGKIKEEAKREEKKKRKPGRRVDSGG